MSGTTVEFQIAEPGAGDPGGDLASAEGDGGEESGDGAGVAGDRRTQSAAPAERGEAGERDVGTSPECADRGERAVARSRELLSLPPSPLLPDPISLPSTLNPRAQVSHWMLAQRGSVRDNGSLR